MGDKEGSTGSSGGGGLSGSTLYVDSMKAMAESIGVANLEDEAAKELAEDVTFRLKLIVQDAAKFMEQGRRVKLTTHDIDFSLKVKNIEVSKRIQKSGGFSRDGGD
jgi:transcription initiation factor TFIID subunit 6